MIEVKCVSKEFIKYEKRDGILGMLISLFFAKKKTFKAIEDVSFKICKGEIVGYIGANGAGKSTTIKMLTGILTPTSGKILVNGIVPYQDRVNNAFNIGVVFGQRSQLWWDLPLIESFNILKRIYNVSDEDFKQRLNYLDEILEIKTFIKSPVRTLSLGQRMRADIVASLLHNPPVLYLDEPTIGLDIKAKKNMRNAIKHLNKKFQTTIILTTHDFDDIEELCNRVIILDKGKVFYDGLLVNLKKNSNYMSCIKFELKHPNEVNINELYCQFKSLGVKKINFKEEKLNIFYSKEDSNTVAIITDILSKFEVVDINIVYPKAEDVVNELKFD